MTNHYHILVETPEANLSQGISLTEIPRAQRRAVTQPLAAIAKYFSVHYSIVSRAVKEREAIKKEI
jgi:hypothetical protein